MASRNYHKRRTKERKKRQAVAEVISRKFERGNFIRRAPVFDSGMAMAAAGAALIGSVTRARNT